MNLDDLIEMCASKVKKLGITKSFVEISLSSTLYGTFLDGLFSFHLGQSDIEQFEEKLEDFLAKLEHYQHRENFTDRFFNKIDTRIKNHGVAARRRNLDSIANFLSDKRITQCVDLYEENDRFLNYVFYSVMENEALSDMPEDTIIETFTENMSCPEVIEAFNLDENAANVLLSHSCYLPKGKILDLANAINSNIRLRDNSVLLFSRALDKLTYSEASLDSKNPEEIIDEADRYLAALSSDDVVTIFEGCKPEKIMEAVNFAEFLVDMAYVTKDSSAVLSVAETLRSFYNEENPRLQDGIKKARKSIKKIAKLTKDPECTIIVSNTLRHFVENKELEDVSYTLEKSVYRLKSQAKNKSNLQLISNSLIEFKDSSSLKSVSYVISRITYRLQDSLLEDTINTLSLYKEKPTLNLATSLIKSYQMDEYVQGLVNKMLRLYVGSNISERVFELLLDPDARSTILLDRSLVCLSQDWIKEHLENVDKSELDETINLVGIIPYSIINILNVTGSSKIDTVDLGHAKLAAQNENLFEELVSDYQRIKGDLTFSESLKYYYNLVYLNIQDKEFRESLSYHNVINIMSAYNLIDDTCQEWPEENATIVKKTFLNNLNTNVSTGKDISDKRKILTEYCGNVVRGIKDNSEDLRFALPNSEQSEKYMSGVSVE
jgi:hypothetical protein